jgi:hypothetical protein
VVRLPSADSSGSIKLFTVRLLTSVATVRFSSVQTLILLDLELNLRFSSGKCLNLELNLPELVQEVRFRFSGGSNPELNLKKL